MNIEPTPHVQPAKLETVTCTWVPATLDRIRLCGRAHDAVIQIERLRELVGRDGIDAVYLTGRYSFECSVKLWQEVERLAGAEDSSSGFD